MGARQPHFVRVKCLMGWDSEKTRLWFSSKNPLLGNVSPDQMLENGKAMRLRQFIDEAERVNK